MAKSAILSIKILTDASKAQKGLDDTSSKVGKFQSGINKASTVAAGALVAVGAAAISAGKAAAEDAQSQAVLAKSLQNAAGASDAQIKSVEDSISAMSAATGVADDQLRPAFATLTRATGDVAKSQDAMALALDISAATGKDVESVSAALAKGYGGNTKALGKLVPGMDKAVLATGDMTKVTDELARLTGGAAAANAETAAGKMARFQLAMDETKEAAGAALLPALSAISGVLLEVGGFAQEHATSFTILAAAIGLIAGAVLAVNAAMKVYQATLIVVQAVQKATFLTNPVFLIIAAVILLVAAIVLLWKKSETFRRVVLGVWAAIKTAAVAVGNVVKAIWNVVWAVLSAYVRAYLAVFRVVFNALRAVAVAVANAMRATWQAVFNAMRAVVNGFRSAVAAVWGAIRSAASAAFSAIRGSWSTAMQGLKNIMSGVQSALTAPFNAVRGVIDSVIGAVNSLINTLRNIRVPKLSFPKIPSIFTRAAPPVSAMAAGVGGGGFRSAAMQAAPVASPRARSSAPTIVIQGAVDPENTARQINRLLGRHNVRVGLTGVLRTG